MEYYSAIKNNEFMKYTGKWMDLENIILREVTLKEHTWYVLTDKWILGKKLRMPMIQLTDDMSSRRRKTKV